MKIHLLDGTYELFRGFYGPPPRKAPDGREVGATIGLLQSLISLLSDPEVTHVACAFDHVVESFRNDLYDGYKTGEGIDQLLEMILNPCGIFSNHLQYHWEALQKQPELARAFYNLINARK